MQYNLTNLSLFTSILSATLTFALPAPAPAPQTTTVCPSCTTPWTVTSYSRGCSPGGCTYHFDISIPAQQGVGGSITTSCSGTDVQNKDVPCDDSTITANVIPQQGGEQVLYVQRNAPVSGGTIIVGGNATTPDVIPEGGATFVIDARSYGEIYDN